MPATRAAAAARTSSRRIPTKAPATVPQEPMRAPDGGLCCVCMDAAQSHAFVPCGHLCACAGCAGEIMEGEKSECWRVSQYDLKLRKGLGFISNIVAAQTAELIAAPMEKLKLDVEQLLKEYKPPEHVVESLELTWKGGLWRMALEMALGVQYLHHHRYECQARVCLRPIHPANSSAGTGAMAGSGTTGRPTRWRRSSRDGRSA